MTTERRASLRRPMRQAADLRFVGTDAAVPCTVRDSSDGGVLVEMATHAEVPARVVLSFHDMQIVRFCRVVRRADRSLGLQYIG